MTSLIDRIDAVSQRLERAREIVRAGKVRRVINEPDYFVVEASTNQGAYLVNSSCSCPDLEYRSELTDGLCKHKLAVVLFTEAKEGTQEAAAEERARCLGRMA
jgi:uncharacterized Zn finger protein